MTLQETQGARTCDGCGVALQPGDVCRVRGFDQEKHRPVLYWCFSCTPGERFPGGYATDYDGNHDDADGENAHKIPGRYRRERW